MKSLLAFLAIFSLLLLYNTVDGRKHPEEYWGRNMRMRVHMRKATEEKPREGKSIEGILDHKAAPDAESDVGESGPLGTSSELVGSGGGTGGGDPKRSLFFKYYGHKVPGN